MTEPNARHGEIVDDAREAVSESMSQLWWAFLLRGVCALVLGLIALFWPTQSIGLLIWIAGLFLVIDGAITLFSVFRGADRNISTLSGAISIVVGVILLLLPVGSARFAFVILGVWATITGLSYLMTWRRIPETDPARETARNLGVVAIVAGAVLVFWPGSGVVALGWAIAFAALVTAAIMFWMSAKFKGVHDRLSLKVVNK
jgi:uncharacterized membrane protein HdeD (DUF308 family)